MTASTIITSYLGVGTHAARPASPNVPSGCTALYYETDTVASFLWDGAAWQSFAATLPSIASGTVLGNSGAGAAVAASTTLTSLIDRALGSTQGQILYRGASGWSALATSTSGFVLKTAGAAADPAWANISDIIDATLGSTRGQILYRGASAWTVLATGTSGNFLKTNGAGADPSWASAATAAGGSSNDVQYNNAGAFGGLTLTNGKLVIGSTGATPVAATLTAGSGITVTNGAGSITVAATGGGGSGTDLISTLTASNSASLAWTGLTQATSWRLIGRLMVPASNNVGLGVNFGTGAGPTYATTGYEFGFQTISTQSNEVNFGAENQAVAPLDDGTTANASPGTSFDMTIVTDNANHVCIFGTLMMRGQSTHWKAEYVGTVLAVAAPITAIKLFFGSGNITSGNASLYNIAA